MMDFKPGIPEGTDPDLASALAQCLYPRADERPSMQQLYEAVLCARKAEDFRLDPVPHPRP